MTLKKTALALAIPVLLAGCGGDDSPDVAEFTPPPEVPVEPAFFHNGDLSEETSLTGVIPTGVYRVALSEVTSASDTDRVESLGTALISRTGRVALALDEGTRSAFARISLDSQGTFEARLLDTDNDFDENLLVRGSRDRVSTSSGIRISGTIVGETNETLLGTYQLDKQAAPSTLTTLANIAGTYRSSSEGVTTGLTLSSTGELTGSDTGGCQYAGTIVIPNSVENVIEMEFEAEGCGPTETITGPARDGTYFALATLDRDQSRLLLLAGNENVAVRFSGLDVDVAEANPPEPEISPVFVSSNLDTDPSVVSRLSPGVYDYENITPMAPPEEGDEIPTPELGEAILSPTGRLVFATNYRTLGARVTVSDVATFRSPATERLQPITEDEDRELDPSTRVEVFGTPDTSSEGPDQVVGSFLNEGQLRNRFRLSRNNLGSDAGVTETQLAGLYQQSLPGGFVTTLNITKGSSDGPGEATLSGSDTTGCSYNGRAVIPDPAVNVVELRFTIGGVCTPSPFLPNSDRTGTYNAVGTVENVSGTDHLNLVMISEGNVLRFFGTKQ